MLANPQPYPQLPGMESPGDLKGYREWRETQPPAVDYRTEYETRMLEQMSSHFHSLRASGWKEMGLLGGEREIKAEILAIEPGSHWVSRCHWRDGAWRTWDLVGREFEVRPCLWKPVTSDEEPPL